MGVRDKARRLGGFGICGMQQCCTAFLGDFAPISTQHARDQALPLNPAKISGNCGRLLCCLRYEAEVYTKCKRKFPPIGSWVKTKQGEGTIEHIDVFKEEAIIRQAENVLLRSSAKDILTTGTTASQEAVVAGAAEYDETVLDDETKEALKKLDDTESAD